jgi:hypothetical protein
MTLLRDVDGTVVINEMEALVDIKSIRDAKAKLQEAVKLLDPARLDDARMSGKAREALGEQFQRICKDLANLGLNCDITNKFIENTVEKYQRIDRELAKAVKGG